jgi:hypothetical protein
MPAINRRKKAGIFRKRKGIDQPVPYVGHAKIVLLLPAFLREKVEI